MNGSAPHPAAKHEWETTAVDVCVFRGNEGDGILTRAIANRPDNEDRLRGIA